jgi:putative transposase
MVSHPAEYPWSSYRDNALEVNIDLLTAHNCYLALGKTAIEGQDTYRALFDQGIDELTLEEIRDATNKAWVLGENRFKQQIEEQAGRRASPLPKSGDRKSKDSKNQPL